MNNGKTTFSKKKTEALDGKGRETLLKNDGLLLTTEQS